jgi:NhaA family Na+:H+ antiporter
MATDIAFALAILAVAAPDRPSSLRAFLLTLAIVDDLGAILVIATVFTVHIALFWLLGGVAVAVVWWMLQRGRIRGWYLYVPLAVICWICVWQSGVHPTISGVALGLLTRSSATDRLAPLDAWEHLWRPISAGVAVPIFALLAAGVVVSGAGLVGLIEQPVALGVITGLVAGKVIGIFGGAYLTARLTRAELATDLRWPDVLPVAVLGGVGFTVALLVAELAFSGNPELQDQAKTAVLVASLLAALVATAAARLRRPTEPG